MSNDSQPEINEPAIDEFAALLHDVRGSIHALRMGLEMLKLRHADSELDELFASMEKEERRAAKLLAELETLIRQRLQ